MENDLFDLIKEQNGVIIVLKESICKLAQAQVLLQKGIKDRPTVIANLRELDIIDTSLHRNILNHFISYPPLCLSFKNRE